MPGEEHPSVVFGGDKLDEIYVTSMARVKHPRCTTAREGSEPQFLAGSLFRHHRPGHPRVPDRASRAEHPGEPWKNASPKGPSPDEL